MEPPSPGPLDGQPEAGTTEEPEPSYTEYKIRRGDTISVIARRFKVDMAELLELNEIDDPRRIQIGQVLKIPK